MSDFKYLNVVESSIKSATTAQKKLYRVLDWSADAQNRSLIEPLHGSTPEHAAQVYLFEHDREFMVYVRKHLPESNYTQHEDLLMSRNPVIQRQLKEEAQVLE